MARLVLDTPADVRLLDKGLSAGEALAAFNATHDRAGAIASFLGKVRPGADVKVLELTHYEPLTLPGMESLAEQALERFALDGVLAWHRVGTMQPGEGIVLVAAAAPHRRAAFDAVDFNGAYKGGIIAPGINLSLDALVGNTAKLPRIAIEKPRTDSVIGRNTEDQMLIGVFWGYVSLMEGLVARIKSEIGRPAKTVATGGLALLFDEHTDLFDAVDSDLTLEGLAILAERALTGAT